MTVTTASRTERAGKIVHISRGLCPLTDVPLDVQQLLAEASRRLPRGGICLASALALHGLTEQMPPKVWIAIGSRDWPPRSRAPVFKKRESRTTSQRYTKV